jgi:hypothetical protein
MMEGEVCPKWVKIARNRATKATQRPKGPIIGRKGVFWFQKPATSDIIGPSLGVIWGIWDEGFRSLAILTTL